MKKEVSIAIISAALAFAGSSAGVLISFHLSQKSWERQVSFEQEAIALKSRIALIERVAKAIAHLDEVKKNIALIEIDKKVRAIELEQGKTPAIISELSEKLSNRVIALEAEYSAVLSLLPIYFGPKTKEIVDKLIVTEVWYQPEEESILNLYEALGEELY